MDKLPGERARFHVPGGHIDISLTHEGVLRIHGVNVLGSYSSQLTVKPESANDVTVELTQTIPCAHEYIVQADDWRQCGKCGKRYRRGA